MSWTRRMSGAAGVVLTASLVAFALGSCASHGPSATDPLPSWTDGPSKRRIVAFVESVSDPSSRDFLPVPERIAVFDNDGTLWSEQPIYFQAAFAFDRVRELAPSRPEWSSRPAIKALIDGDRAALAAAGQKGLLEIVMASHAGMTTAEFDAIVRQWASTARHPTLGRPYTSLTYQPMLELLGYLRARGFATWIVSGGGIDFLRVLASDLYGIPPEQVVGSSVKTRYEVRDGKPVLVRLPEIAFVDDGPGKPVGIHSHVGRRPIAAFGNSDGDFEMLQYTTAGPGPRLGVIIHHDDAAREYAYDRTSHVGKLARGLDAAPANRWQVVSMKDDWRTIYPPVR